MKIKIPDKEILLFATAIAGIVICITVECISLAGIMKIKEETPTKEIACEVTENMELLTNNAIYRLRECGGKVGIYDAETNIIIDIIDIFVSTLPKNDRIALKNGIEIYSFKELSEIINDFST